MFSIIKTRVSDFVEGIKAAFALAFHSQYPLMVDPTPDEHGRQSTWLMLCDNRDGCIRDEFVTLVQVLTFIECIWNETLCLVAGHKLNDAGHAGPDSGCIHVYCERCQKDYGTQWLY